MAAAAGFGPEQQRVEDALTGDFFRHVSVTQYAPDGEHILGEIYWLVCSLCGAMVPTPAPEQEMLFDQDHVEWHKRVATALDAGIS